MSEQQRLRRNDWRVDRIVEHSEAAALIRAWHYSKSCPNTSVYRHGLYTNDVLSLCYGVALWLPPMNTTARALTGDDTTGVLALSRFVIDPEMPPNAASFLLGASMRMIDRRRWPVLVTYADTALGHTGAIYRATNWRCDGPVAAGDVWVMPDGSLCGRKRGPRSLTVAEMRALGASRRPAAPKIRYVHDVRRHSTRPVDNRPGGARGDR